MSAVPKGMTCSQCGAEFTGRGRAQSYCSPACRYAAKAARRRAARPRRSACLHCGGLITGKRSDAKFCSAVCSDRFDYELNRQRYIDSARDQRMAKSPEQRRAEQRDHWRRNREKILARQRAWVSRNKEYHREYQARYGREWRQRHPHLNAVYVHNRNKRLRSNRDGMKVRPEDWLAVLQRYDGKCAYCSSATWVEMDHVIPLARGGRHAIGNLLPACAPCNRSKGSRLLIEWKIRKAVTT